MKYYRKDIEMIMKKPNPTVIEAFEEANRTIEILASILPDAIGMRKRIICGDTVLYKRCVYYGLNNPCRRDFINLKTRYPWFVSGNNNVNLNVVNQLLRESPREDDMLRYVVTHLKQIPSSWCDIIKYRSDAIRQAVIIRQNEIWDWKDPFFEIQVSI